MNIVSREKPYAAWTDLVFGRLLGVNRFRENTIDRLGDSWFIRLVYQAGLSG